MGQLPRPLGQKWIGWAAWEGGSGWDVEALVAATQHGGGDSRHDGLRMYMQVAVHFVGVPAPDEANAIRVNAATKHGHGATRPRGAGRDIAGGEVRERGGAEAAPRGEEGTR